MRTHPTSANLQSLVSEILTFSLIAQAEGLAISQMIDPT